MNDNRSTERSVRKAFGNATPNVLDSIQSDCPACATASRAVTRRNYWKLATCALACLLLLVSVFSVVGLAGRTPDTALACQTVVTMDVNPSLQISVDTSGKVISVTAANADAEKIVGTMDFSGSSLEVTVYALIGAMYSKGYLSEIANSVLVDVDTTADKTQIADQVTGYINDALKRNDITPNVIVGKSDSELTSEENQTASEVSNEYNVSIAKARLIAQILQHDSKNIYTAAQLVTLKVNDLTLLLEGLVGVSVGSGVVSEGAYIGKESAKQKALESFGVTAEQATNLKVKLDYEDGMMVYEVEFETTNKDGVVTEHECKIVAGRMALNAGTVFEMESETKLDKDCDKKLSDVEKLLFKQSVVSKVTNYLVEKKFISLADSLKDMGLADKVKFDDQDNCVEIEFDLDDKHFEFEYNYDGVLTEVKVTTAIVNGEFSQEDYDALKDKLATLVSDRWNTAHFGVLEDGILNSLDWQFELDGNTIECSVDIAVGSLRVEVEVKIDKTSGALVDVEIEVD